MADVSYIILLATVFGVAAWIGNRLYWLYVNSYKANLALQAQFPRVPGSLIAGNATMAEFGSQYAYLWFTDILKRYGRSVACRLLTRPVGLNV
jgi:hypothetical protein